MLMFTLGITPIKSSGTNAYVHARYHAVKSSDTNAYVHARYHANKE